MRSVSALSPVQPHPSCWQENPRLCGATGRLRAGPSPAADPQGCVTPWDVSFCRNVRSRTERPWPNPHARAVSRSQTTGSAQVWGAPAFLALVATMGSALPCSLGPAPRACRVRGRQPPSGHVALDSAFPPAELPGGGSPDADPARRSVPSAGLCFSVQYLATGENRLHIWRASSHSLSHPGEILQERDQTVSSVCRSIFGFQGCIGTNSGSAERVPARPLVSEAPKSLGLKPAERKQR